MTMWASGIAKGGPGGTCLANPHMLIYANAVILHKYVNRSLSDYCGPSEQVGLHSRAPTPLK